MLLPSLSPAVPAGCPASTFVKSIGKAEQFLKLLQNQAAAVCQYVKEN